MFRRPKTAVLCAYVAVVVAVAPARSAPEFRVNTTTFLEQRNAGVAVDPTGRFMVVWTGQGSEQGYQVWMQRYSASGLPIGTETRVNTTTAGVTLGFPRVTPISSGGFAVTWIRGTSGFDMDIYAQRFDGGLNPAGAEFRVNTYTSDSQYAPDIAADGAGNFVVVWSGVGADDHGGIFGRRFDSAGMPQDSAFRINTYTSGNETNAAVARSFTGGFVVAWLGYPSASGARGVLAQRFSPTGAPVSAAFRVNTYTTDDATAPSLAMDIGGSLVIAWTAHPYGTPFTSILAQRFSPTGSPSGGPFRVNATTTGYTNVSAVTRRNADFVVVWNEFNGTPSAEDIVARRFDASGADLGSPFRVNTTTTGMQRNAAIASRPDGAYVIVWDSEVDGSDYGVFGRNFCLGGDANGDGTVNVSDILYLINNLFAGGAPPSGCADADGNFVLNVADILYLINYLFAGGPAPV